MSQPPRRTVKLYYMGGGCFDSQPVSLALVPLPSVTPEVSALAVSPVIVFNVACLLSTPLMAAVTATGSAVIAWGIAGRRLWHRRQQRLDYEAAIAFAYHQRREEISDLGGMARPIRQRQPRPRRDPINTVG